MHACIHLNRRHAHARDQVHGSGNCDLGQALAASEEVSAKLEQQMQRIVAFPQRPGMGAHFNSVANGPVYVSEIQAQHPVHIISGSEKVPSWHVCGLAVQNGAFPCAD